MLRLVATTTTAFIYLQIIVGATMRHSDAGLAIPDFPLVFGGLIPPEWTPQIAIHYAHRVGALIVTLAIAATAGHVWYHHPRRAELRKPALTLVCLVLAQVTLGAFVIWSEKNVAINTAHVVVGALTLATSLVLTLRSHQVRFGRAATAAVGARGALDHLRGARVKKGSGALLGAVDEKLHPTPFAPAAHRVADFLSLTKPRLNSLVVVTAGIGYYLGAGGDLHLASLVEAVLGIALVAGGAAGLNQIYERDTDSLMFRTRMRPLAAQRVTTSEALVFSLALAAAGLVIVAASSNLLAAFLTLLTLVSYNLVYTPMKRRSQLATLVGAVPGALPPMIGWVAARGTLTPEAWALFAIVFVWQIPHFMAIAWLYRADFGRAGFPLLPVVEPTGRSTATSGRAVLARARPAQPRSVLSAHERPGVCRRRRGRQRRALVAGDLVCPQADRRTRAAAVSRVDHVPAAALGNADPGSLCDRLHNPADRECHAECDLRHFPAGGLRADSPPPDQRAPQRHARRIRVVHAVPDLLSHLSRAGGIAAVHRSGH